MAEGEFADVRNHLEEALNHSAEWVGDHDLYAMLAEAAVGEENLEVLKKYVPLAEETAVRYGHNLYQAIANRSWGVAHRLAGEFSQAEDRLNRALVSFQNMETRWQVGRTLVELGLLNYARGELALAGDFFRKALVEFASLAASRDTQRVQALLEGFDEMRDD